METLLYTEDLSHARRLCAGSYARLDGLTRDLMRDVGRSGIKAQLVETHPEPGERSVMAIMGNFVVDALISGKVAAAGLDVLKAYLVRERSLRISVVKPDGTKIEIDAKNVSSTAVAEFLGAAKPMVTWAMSCRVAILIGSEKFASGSGLDNLGGPHNDVAALQKVLGDPARGDFEVHTFLPRPDTWRRDAGAGRVVRRSRRPRYRPACLCRPRQPRSQRRAVPGVGGHADKRALFDCDRDRGAA
jgi:hypothetical protein